MIMTKEIDKGNLDNTAQSYLKESQEFLQGTYTQYNERAASAATYVRNIESYIARLNRQLQQLRNLGVDVMAIQAEMREL